MGRREREQLTNVFFSLFWKYIHSFFLDLKSVDWILWQRRASWEENTSLVVVFVLGTNNNLGHHHHVSLSLLHYKVSLFTQIYVHVDSCITNKCIDLNREKGGWGGLGSGKWEFPQTNETASLIEWAGQVKFMDRENGDNYIKRIKL